MKRIKEDKELLLVNKKIKKGKLQDVEMQNELIFEILESWVLCKLDEICKMITDGTHQTPKEYGFCFYDFNQF